jgi:elongation factor Ts
MAEITTALVKELRERTGAGMMDCKRALSEAGGDVEAATDWLRKKGLVAAAKKASRVTSEGLIGMALTGTSGALVEVNAETDFVARNETFQALVRQIAALAPQAKGDLDVLRAARIESSGRTVDEEITQAIALIGENINLRRTAYLEVPQGVVAGYLHNQLVPGVGKLGVLVALASPGKAESVAETGKQLAMHVAVLLEQVFVIDTEKRVKEAVQGAAKQAGMPIEVVAFVRMALGEGVEKGGNDFAAEVAQLAGV